MSTNINKPEPIAIDKEISLFKYGTNIKSTIENLEAGKPILITEFYNNGISLLQDLHKYLKTKLPNKSFLYIRSFLILF